VRLAAVVGCMAAALAVGCGTIESEPADSGTSTATKPMKLFTFVNGTSSSTTMWAIEDRVERQPLKDLYAVFRRVPTSRETAITERVAANWPCAGPEDSKTNEPLPELTRILLRDVGPRGYDLVAQPTENDDVAMGLFPGGSAGCSRPADEDGLMLASEVDQKGDAIVYGMVGDSITAVEVVVDGVPEGVRLGENGFAHEIPDAVGQTVDRVRLYHADGSVTTFPEEG
jgi:hypothetical protein